MAVDLAPELLEILACPNCHGPLAVDHERDELVCQTPDCGLAYPVRERHPRAPGRRGASPRRGPGRHGRLTGPATPTGRTTPR